MQAITTFTQLLDAFKAMSVKKRVALVSPDDSHTLDVLRRCLEEKLAVFHVVTDNKTGEEFSAIAQKWAGDITVHHCDSVDDAARKGVKLVRTGQADVLMKGTINTDNLLRAVLDKENGILTHGNVMTHATLVEVPSYDKLILFSDAAVIPRPNLEQFTNMVRYDINICRTLRISQPKVALIHFTEKINEKFPHTIDYRTLREKASEGAFGDAIVDGPMDVKTACDAHSAAIKGIASPVCGNADILIFPNLEAGNTFYKTVSFFCHAKMAGIICGTQAPVVVPSRADSTESKFYSLALACLCQTK